MVRFGTQSAPQETPPPWDQKASRRGPKLRFWDLKIDQKGGLGRPEALKMRVLGSKHVLFGRKWGPQIPAFLRGVQKSRLRKVRYLRISEKRETKTLHFYDVGESPPAKSIHFYTVCGRRKTAFQHSNVVSERRKLRICCFTRSLAYAKMRHLVIYVCFPCRTAGFMHFDVVPGESLFYKPRKNAGKRRARRPHFWQNAHSPRTLERARPIRSKWGQDCLFRC